MKAYCVNSGEKRVMGFLEDLGLGFKEMTVKMVKAVDVIPKEGDVEMVV